MDKEKELRTLEIQLDGLLMDPLERLEEVARIDLPKISNKSKPFLIDDTYRKSIKSSLIVKALSKSISSKKMDHFFNEINNLTIGDNSKIFSYESGLWSHEQGRKKYWIVKKEKTKLQDELVAISGVLQEAHNIQSYILKKYKSLTKRNNAVFKQLLAHDIDNLVEGEITLSDPDLRESITNLLGYHLGINSLKHDLYINNMLVDHYKYPEKDLKMILKSLIKTKHQRKYKKHMERVLKDLGILPGEKSLVAPFR